MPDRELSGALFAALHSPSKRCTLHSSTHTAYRSSTCSPSQTANGVRSMVLCMPAVVFACCDHTAAVVSGFLDESHIHAFLQCLTGSPLFTASSTYYTHLDCAPLLTRCNNKMNCVKSRCANQSGMQDSTEVCSRHTFNDDCPAAISVLQTSSVSDPCWIILFKS